eukprot:9476636-Prorocentrum_lima.AAC.1
MRARIREQLGARFTAITLGTGLELLRGAIGRLFCSRAGAGIFSSGRMHVARSARGVAGTK